MYVLNAKQSKQATKKKRRKTLLKNLVVRCKIRGGGSLLEFHSSVLTDGKVMFVLETEGEQKV